MKLTDKYVEKLLTSSPPVKPSYDMTAEMEEILKRAIKQRRRSIPKKRIQMIWPLSLWREIQRAMKSNPTQYSSVTQFVLIACRKLLDSKPGQ